MTLHRFFISKDCFNRDTVIFPSEQSYQIARVLRLSPQDTVIALDNSGTEYFVELLQVDSKRSIGSIKKTTTNKNESLLSVTLYQSVIAREKFELVIQKATELGVKEIVPIITARTQQHDKNLIGNKQNRWEKIIREASEQSERGKLLEIKMEMNFEEAINKSSSEGKVIIGWERGIIKHLSVINSPKISIFVGPEGGFTEEEIKYAIEKGAETFTLGPRILRAETAGIVLPALILNHE